MDIFNNMKAFLCDFVGESVDAKFEDADKWHSLKTDKFKGAYIYTHRKYKDKNVYVLTVRDWRSDNFSTKTFGAEGLTKSDLASLSRAEKEHQEQNKKERERKNIEARDYCQKEWDLLTTPNEVTKYTHRKNIKPIGHVKTRPNIFGDHDLLIGIYDETDTFWGYQVIRPDGAKDFQEGQRIKGCFAKIDGDKKIIYIAEGYATAATIAESTKAQTYAAFSAWNMPLAAKSIRQKHPKAIIIICADNDKYKPELGNIGVEKATDAAKTIDASVGIPTFQDETLKPTDYNDLLTLEGPSELARQLSQIQVTRPNVLYPLGFAGQTFFLSSSTNPQLNGFSDLSSTDLLKVMPLYYWEREYGEINMFGDTVVDWIRAKDHCMQECRKVGVFYETKVRGCGVWLDEGRVVEHFGERLRVDGEEMHLQDIETNCIYEIRPHRKLIKEEPVAKEKVLHATKLIESLSWENPLHGRLFLGGVAVGMIAGSLKWRPHLMVTGEAGSGKSTLLNYVAVPLLDASGKNKSANTTEAGFRQQVKSDSLPYLIDEFDTNNSNPKMLQGVLNLMRASSSGEDMRRGTPSGKALTFSARFSFLTFGINPPIMNEADQSRITMMHLTKKKQKGHWPDLEKELVETFTEEFGGGMYMRMVQALPTFEKTVSDFHKIIAAKFSQRKAQQYGVLLAGYYVLSGGGSIEALVDEWIKGETQENLAEDSGPKECLKHLLDLKVDGEDLQGLHTLGGLLEQYGNHLSLANYGIRYVESDNSLYVSVKNARLQAWFDKTQWVKYSTALARIDGAKISNIRVNGVQTKCIHVPLSVVEFERKKSDV